MTDSLPARSLKDLVALARSKPGELTWGAGPSLPYFAFAATVRRHQLNMVHVPYRDAATPQADLSEGRVHVLCNSLQALAGPVGSGKAHILAVTSRSAGECCRMCRQLPRLAFPGDGNRRPVRPLRLAQHAAELRDRIAADMQAIANDSDPARSSRGERPGASYPRHAGRVCRGDRAATDPHQQIMHIIDLKSAMK